MQVAFLPKRRLKMHERNGYILLQVYAALCTARCTLYYSFDDVMPDPIRCMDTAGHVATLNSCSLDAQPIRGGTALAQGQYTTTTVTRVRHLTSVSGKI